MQNIPRDPRSFSSSDSRFDPFPPANSTNRTQHFMKSPIRLLTLCALLGVVLNASAVGGEIPNGTFDAPAGAPGTWLPVSGGGGSFTYSYPTTGGNPNGYGIISHTSSGGFGIWVANNGAPLTLASLGLTAGQSYTFLQDMKIISGTRIGGFKIDFFAGATQIGSTGNLYPASGSGVWTTYSFPVTINAGADGIKVVPLWGPGSSVGYDNIRIKPTAPFVGTIVSGNLVTWTATNGNTYQPQKSVDNAVWTNFGTALFGGTVASRLDSTVAPFYRVLEVIPGSAGNEVLNPGFETASGNSLGAESWNIAVQPNTGASMTISTQYAATSPHGGANMLLIESTTAASGPVAAPNTDVRSNLFPVVAGTTYDFSFYAANPVKIGGANPQYSIFFYDGNNGAVGGPIFASFAAVGGNWTKVVTTVTPPAGATQMTVGWIQAMGAGNGWHWVTLIDDVSLSTGPISPDITNVLPTINERGVEVGWPSSVGTIYRVQNSEHLAAWADYGGLVAGNGLTNTAREAINAAKKFYRVVEQP